MAVLAHKRQPVEFGVDWGEKKEFGVLQATDFDVNWLRSFLINGDIFSEAKGYLM